MDVISGKQLQISDAVYAYQLDGKGGATPIDPASEVTSEKPCWIHLDYTLPASGEWLSTTPLLPDAVRDALGTVCAPASAGWGTGR